MQSQPHSLIHGTVPGKTSYHSPVGKSIQRLKPRTERLSIHVARSYTQPAQTGAKH